MNLGIVILELARSIREENKYRQYIDASEIMRYGTTDERTQPLMEMRRTNLKIQ